MRYLSIRTLFALPLLAITGCGGGADSGAPAAGDATEDLAPTQFTVQLEEVNESAAEGQVTIALDGAEYQADVIVDTHRGPGDYPVNIHTGTCAQGGPVAVPLISITGQEGGEGQQRSSFAASAITPGQSYFIQLLDAQSADPLACADLPALGT